MYLRIRLFMYSLFVYISNRYHVLTYCTIVCNTIVYCRAVYKYARVSTPYILYTVSKHPSWKTIFFFFFKLEIRSLDHICTEFFLLVELLSLYWRPVFRISLILNTRIYCRGVYIRTYRYYTCIYLR